MICSSVNLCFMVESPAVAGEILTYRLVLKSGSMSDARRVVARFVEEYNEQRLHSAIGYVTPRAKLEGREQQIFKERDRKLEVARAARAVKRQQARSQSNQLKPGATNSISG
jgi:hypothetical protein